MRSHSRPQLLNGEKVKGFGIKGVIKLARSTGMEVDVLMLSGYEWIGM